MCYFECEYGVGEDMTSPLALFKEVSKDLSVKEEHQLNERQKQAFAESQLAEQKAILNRLIVDCALARHELSNAKDDLSKGAHQKKVTEYEEQIKQFVRTVTFFSKLVGELGGSNNVEAHPESI